VRLLKEGVLWSQPFRHGRADDEWARIRIDHVQALVKLDGHRSLRVRERLVDKTFEDAVVLCFEAEAESQLPWDPKERSMVPNPVECPQCWRDTLIAQEWDAWGIEVGEGVCIACGFERTYEDTVNDAMDRVMRDGC
jgi:Zn ribbon nucleic-acid-binding protein